MLSLVCRAFTPGRSFGPAPLKQLRYWPINIRKFRGPRGQVLVRGVVKTNRALDFERKRIAVVMIRLARFGARKQPYYRIVAIEKDRARNGRSIEVVGTYNPRTSPATVDLKHDRIAYWRSVGAQFSTIVEKLVAKNPAGATPAAPLTPSAPVKVPVAVEAATPAEAPVEA
jgi:small subunit ribosomal protein S16